VLKRSVELYKTSSRNRPRDRWKMTGCLRLATTADRWTEFKRLATTARSFGMDMELISPAEVKKMWPLLETSTSWAPRGCRPTARPHLRHHASLARGARMHGATILKGCASPASPSKAGASRRFDTDGPIACER